MHRRAARLSVFGFATLLATSFAFSQTADAKPAVAVLRVDVVLTGGKTDAKTAVVANKLTGAIRRATRERGPYRLAPNTNKDLLELKLLYNCSNEAPVCMSKIGRSLKSRRLLWGKLAHKGDHYLVTVNLLNVRRKAMLRSTTVRIPMNQASSAGLRRWGRLLYSRLTGMKDHGRLHIVANTSSGVVFIDGNPATNLKNGKADIAGLPDGAHKLEIKADGFKPYSRTIAIEGGKKTTVSATLEANASPVFAKKRGTTTKSEPGGIARIMFWTTAAATMLSGVAMTVTGLQVRGTLKDDQTEAIITLRAATGIELDPNNACADAVIRGMVAKGVIDACEAGTSRAQLFNVFLGVGIVSAIAAGYFYWKGYGGGGSGKESAGTNTTRIRVLPSVGPDHVGAGLSLEF